MTFKPTIGAWCVIYGIGPYLWLDTMSNRARDARRKMGDMLVGRVFDGVAIKTTEEGWAWARRNGYRVVKVDVFPHGDKQ